MHQIKIFLQFWNSLLKLWHLSYLDWHMYMDLHGSNYANRLYGMSTFIEQTKEIRITSAFNHRFLRTRLHQHALKDMCPNPYCLASEFRFGGANVTYLHHCISKSFKAGRSHFSVMCPKNVCKRPMFEPIYFDRHFQRLFLVWLKSCRRIIDR